MPAMIRSTTQRSRSAREPGDPVPNRLGFLAPQHIAQTRRSFQVSASLWQRRRTAAQLSPKPAPNIVNSSQILARAAVLALFIPATLKRVIATELPKVNAMLKAAGLAEIVPNKVEPPATKPAFVP